jgi:hypothetical protein
MKSMPQLSRPALLALLLATLGNQSAASAMDASAVRINQLQYIGTHNSYHAGLAPSETIIWQRYSLEKIEGTVAYAHPSLTRQLDDGVRQLELDVYRDPAGGRYAHPAITGLVRKAGLPPDTPPADPAVMQRPGYKVMHIQDLDQRSVCQPFTACLQEIRAWSLAHPRHVPVFILVETVRSVLDLPFRTVTAEPYDGPALDALDAEVRAVFARGEYIVPDDVRGNYPTLNAAIRARGWPSLAKARGKVIFLLDQRWVGPIYLRGHPSLGRRVFFTNAVPDAPDAAFTELNDGPADDIARLVKQGYLVRTRTDTDLVEAEHGDTRRRDAMFASGAQLLSTDFPAAEPATNGYAVGFADHLPARCNPQQVPASCKDDDLHD